VRKKQPEERWITAREATKILSEKAGRPISPSYVRSLVRLGKVETKELDGRTNVYKASDVENYVVQPRHKRKAIKEEIKQKVESPAKNSQAAGASIEKEPAPWWLPEKTQVEDKSEEVA